MKRTLISVQGNQTKIAITLNGKLVDLHIDSADIKLQKSNIYMGRISHIEPSLNAVFVNYGDTKDAFLPMKDIAGEYVLKNDAVIALKVNQNLIVQVSKDKRGNKGAHITTFISLAGCYIVFMPNSPKAKPGVSKRVPEKDRERIKVMLADLDLPEEGKIIARSASIYATLTLIQNELAYLMLQWANIKAKAQQSTNIGLIYQDNTLAARIMREYLIEEKQEVVIDNQEILQSLKSLLQISRPALANRIHLFHQRNVNIFQYYGVEQAIKNIFDREIPLKSGGSIVIDSTEALIAIDVNSAKSTHHRNIEETALNTNLEAVAVIADQLRFRNISGLIVVDLIDMANPENRLLVEEKLLEAMNQDRARIQMTRISKLGLIEISRQNLSPPVRDTLMLKCSACSGLGRVPADHSFTLAVVHSIKTHLHTHPAPIITVKVPHNIALKIIEHHLPDMLEIESAYQTRVIFLSDQSYSSAYVNINGMHYQHDNQTVAKNAGEPKFAGLALQDLFRKFQSFLFGFQKQEKQGDAGILGHNRAKIADTQLPLVQPNKRKPNAVKKPKKDPSVAPAHGQHPMPKSRKERNKSKDKGAEPTVVVLPPAAIEVLPLTHVTAPVSLPEMSSEVLALNDDFIEVETRVQHNPA